MRVRIGWMQANCFAKLIDCAQKVGLFKPADTIPIIGVGCSLRTLLHLLTFAGFQPRLFGSRLLFAFCLLQPRLFDRSLAFLLLLLQANLFGGSLAFPFSLLQANLFGGSLAFPFSPLQPIFFGSEPLLVRLGLRPDSRRSSDCMKRFLENLNLFRTGSKAFLSRRRDSSAVVLLEHL